MRSCPSSAAVLQQDRVGAGKPALAEDPQRCDEALLECPHTVSQHHRAPEEVQFVDQAMGQEVVPQHMAAENEEIALRARLDLRDAGVCLPPNHHFGIAPGRCGLQVDRVSLTTTLFIAPFSQAISRCRGLAPESSATIGQ